MRRARPGLALAYVIAAACLAALALVVLVGHEEAATALAGLDADDSAFFSGSSSFTSDGDREMLRANEAMSDKDLSLALDLSRDAERSYEKGLADRRLEVAKKVEQQLKAAIAAGKDAHRSRIGEVLKHAEQLNAKAQAAAVGEKPKLAHDKLSSSEQVKLLRKSQQILGQRVHSSKVAAAAKRIAALADEAGKSAPTKLSTMDDPDKVLDLNPGVAFPPTHQAGNQWDAEPVPKVLDCGPLSNNCNTKQGGEYYSHHKGDQAGAEKKGALAASSQHAAAKARFAMLAKGAPDAKSASGGILAEPLLKETSSRQDRQQLRWLQGRAAPGVSPTETFLSDLASMRVRGQRQQQLHEDGAVAGNEGVATTGQTILQAGDKLDDMQQRLNERREAVFAEFVGPLALMGGHKASLAVTVKSLSGRSARAFFFYLQTHASGRAHRHAPPRAHSFRHPLPTPWPPGPWWHGDVVCIPGVMLMAGGSLPHRAGCCCLHYASERGGGGGRWKMNRRGVGRQRWR